MPVHRRVHYCVFGRNRIQIVDLGHQVVKSIIGSVQRDGGIVVDSVRVDRVIGFHSDLPALLTALGPVLDELGRKFFYRRVPVHIVPDPTVVRSAVHALPEVEDEAVPEILRTSRRHFLGSYGTRGPILQQSLPIHVTRIENFVRVTAVHSYVKLDDVEVMRRALAAAGLIPGGVLSPILALAGLAGITGQAVGPGDEVGDEGLRLMVDVGATGATVLLSKGQTLTACRRVHAGLDDWMRHLQEEIPDLDSAGMGRLLQYVIAGGPAGATEAAEALGLHGDVGAALVERVQYAWDRVLGAILGVLPRMIRPASGPDESLDDATADFDESGEKQEAPIRLVPPVIFTGGAGGCEAFMQLARERLGIDCAVLDPGSLAGVSLPSRLAVHGASLAPAVGSLLAISRSGIERVNVAEEYVSLTGQTQRDERALFESVRRPLIAGAFFLVCSGIGLGAASLGAESDLRDLTQSLEMEKAGVPPTAEIQKVLVSYRDLVSREVSVDARFTYVGETLQTKVRWAEVFEGIARCAPEGECAIGAVEFKSLWPTVGDVPAGSKPKVRSVGFTVRGDARSLSLVTQYAQTLKLQKWVKEARLGSSRVVTGTRGGASQGKTTYDYEILGELDLGQGSSR